MTPESLAKLTWLAIIGIAIIVWSRYKKRNKK